MAQSQNPSRRRFIRTAGITLGGGSAVLGVTSASATSAEASETSTLSVARKAGFSALAETMAGLRTAGDPREAGRRFSEWYAAADPGERAEFNAALDALPGEFSSLGAKDRLALLVEHLGGPREGRLTTAIGLAVAGLSQAHAGPGTAAVAGRLYARTIRAMPEQAAARRDPQPKSGAGLTPCPISKG